MQLSLFGWPPVASHVTCLLTGLALSHLTQVSHAESPRFPPHSVLIALDAPRAFHADPTLKPGSRIYVVKKEGAERCRTQDVPFLLVASKPQIIIAIPQHMASSVTLFTDAESLDSTRTKRVKTNAFEIVPAANAGSLLPCLRPPRVTYG